jgi:subtilisin family serine protease
MLGHGIRANLGGAAQRLPREVAKFLIGQEWLFGSAPEEKPCVYQRRLRIESLESRRLMDAAAAASLVDPLWFQNVAGADVPAHAGTADWTIESVDSSASQNTTAQTGASNVYDWVIQFNTAALAGIDSVAETAGLLAGGGVQFQVLEGLGLNGMVLARSSGASLDAARDWLDSNINVASFERDAVDQVSAVPSDPQYSQLWGMSAIDAPAAWNISTGSSSVVVAVIDTGVDYTHRDLAANIWTNPGEIAGNGIDDDGNGFVDDVHGYDFVNNDGNPMDDNSHGTHVAGTIAAVANNGQGVAGVNWTSSIMALKFLDADGSGYLSDAIRAVNYATMMRTQYGVNVRVMNNSWGGGEYSSALESAIRASGNADILFVAAAGNDATNNDTSPQYPANYSPANVISVAAVDQTDHLASFSCYGASTVDIAAPGVSIYSTVPGNRYAIYSGTSMATPFVAGVAALAWAVDPTATVAEVRSAILSGADRVSALSGKVASGGVLNAHTTLTLLGSQTQSGPAITSLVATPNSVTVGTAVAISARGISDDSATVTSVSFYLDANNNGQYDSSDQSLGSTSSIAGGQAGITIGSSALGVGTHRILARAQDSAGKWSSCASTTLTVSALDDYGDSAAAAAAISVPSSTAAQIDKNGDMDWFKFQAAAGKSYVFNVQLGTLADSVLYLYGSGGTSQLAFNDDYGSSSASRITWTAPSSGVYYLAVGAYGNSSAGTYALGVQEQNAAPVLAAIGNRSLAYPGSTLAIGLQASDGDGDSLTYSVHAMTIDSLAQKAYALDQQLGLHTYPNGNYYTNARGAGEKYLIGNGDVLYFIKPNGSLYRWGGSIAKSVLVDTLSSAYYANPALLQAAQSPGLMSISSSSVTVSISGNVLNVTRQPGFTGVLCVRVTVSDGQQTDSEIFTVADPLAQKAYDLDQQLGLHTYADGNYYTNARGAGEKYLIGSDNVLYFINPDGGLYRWGGSIAKSTCVATLSSAYYTTPSLLHDAQSPTLSASQISSAANVTSAASTSVVGADGVSPEILAANTVFLAEQSNAGLLASASVATTAQTDNLRASLHDRVLSRASSGDSQAGSECLAAIDQPRQRIVFSNLTDSDADLAAGLTDCVFDMLADTSVSSLFENELG